MIIVVVDSSAILPICFLISQFFLELPLVAFEKKFDIVAIKPFFFLFAPRYESCDAAELVSIASC